MRPRNPTVTALAFVSALVAAFTAQYLFTGEVFTRFEDSNTWEWTSRYSAGAGLLLVAIAVAAWFGRRDDGADP